LSKNLFVLKIGLLLLSTLIIILVSASIGSVDIPFSDLLKIIFSDKGGKVYSQIFYDIRLPRILLAVAVGGGLSVAGAVFQAILMNPLAEPYILGISSGGAFGAVLSFLIGVSFLGTQFFAFAGSLSVVVLVFLLGRRFGELEPNVLLLTGVMVGAFFSAAILLMMTMLNDSLRTAVFWLIGNLSLADKGTVVYVLPVSIVISFLLSLNAQKYNVLSLGEENAKHLGINTSFIKNTTYILASILVGSLVSVSGIIGFVGLLVPHACRMLFGIDNRIVIPASFFVGASYLALADSISRTLISPAELPVGAVTALIGAPIFVYLLRKRFNLIT
jgi:iron complex transport system permease protein